MLKLKAFLIHFSISLTVFLTVILLVLFLWYPSIYLEASGVIVALRMVALVDVGLGPLMTLILFKPKKPGLKFDLTVVATVQIIALCYGVWVLYSQKPELAVYHQGMFVCLNKSQVKTSGADRELLLGSNYPVPLAVLPALSSEQLEDWQQRQNQLSVEMPKHPAYVYGESFLAYGPQHLSSMLQEAWDLTDQLKVDKAAREEWDKYRREHSEDASHAYFMFSCGMHQFMVAVDTYSANLVALIDVPFFNARQRPFNTGG